ncbi:hypothetical protein BDW02DRAFT_592411 [Decorospora gaudefroyi]|uniref:HTH CENPB-type domain-containing protein n=1 Tax=Decorospora gaudefroyi TaxID=184978 RepID=A0A6A5K5F9_9PLEO|nr:hypothetical protein BDW02DRAFT_592411 [Decorospora gaudefroyi]
MDLILDAIAAIEAREPGESFSYREVAKRFGGNSQPHIEAMQEHYIVDPHYEKELVQYIESLTARGLLPSKSMIKNFASTVSKWEVSDRWVDRFLDRNNPNLTIRYTVSIDRDRQQADTEEAYRLYFDILNSKIKLYEIEAQHSYNMDEKGFFVGKTTKRKRVFSRQMYEAKLVKEALQDGDRSWVTLLAAICADGTSIDPAIIFAAKGDLRENWVTDLDPEQH